MTYSIVARDADNGDLGIAVQSKFPNVGGLVPYARAEIGAVATQGFGNPRHGTTGLVLIEHGATPGEALDILLRGDPDRDRRQVAMVAATGETASYTGREVHTWGGWAGSAGGAGCVALGNGLANDRVPARMVEGFEARGGELAVRLIAALRAGEDAGGELRGQQSAALLVVRRDGGYGGLDDRLVTISIYDHDRPIDELARCYEMHRLSYFPSDPANLIKIDSDLARELKQLLVARGFYGGGVDGEWGVDAIEAMQRFMGWENYDNRIRDDGLIDSEVLADMRSRHTRGV
nr:DUF1028 domain-containing protein [Micromonospora sp. DSM 115978]